MRKIAYLKLSKILGKLFMEVKLIFLCAERANRKGL